jgi:tRNA U34 5-carboxymethylaminomethyl modifying GTPase MnmE/TrmE
VYKDTIYSLGTGFGKSAIAILRISGPGATDAI